MSRLRTRDVRSSDGVRVFFDGIAGDYRESHGGAGRLLEYRLKLIRRLLDPGCGGVLLEIGCGPGVHLFPLAGPYQRAIGVDLSPNMIAAAETIRRTHPHAARIELHAGPAERLSSVDSRTVDAAVCVGAFEHMSDQPAVLREVHRVLKPGGRFVCLTVNGDCLWYRRIAPRLGYAVKHLSSDRFITGRELRVLLREAALETRELGYWRFVAAGDMPGWAAWTFAALDRAGSFFKPAFLRGGLYVCAIRN